MVYNFNLGIGWASSGVEYAQAYRANLFRKAGIHRYQVSAVEAVHAPALPQLPPSSHASLLQALMQ